MKTVSKLTLVAVLALSTQLAQANTCLGNCGTLGADGVVSVSPLGGDYQYVSTDQGVTGVSPYNLGVETNGSKFTTSLFSANAGSLLDFYFNYVTSDGSGFSDYGWARLLNGDGSEAALLFTARTQASGNIIPGQGLPTPDAAIPTATIIPGGPAWSPLGSSSGRCFDAGCGYTGWVESIFTIATAGDYMLQYGVVNWQDTGFQSGLAVDGITVDGEPISPVPLPAALPLMFSALGALGFVRHKVKK